MLDAEQSVQIGVALAALSAELAPLSDQAWKALSGQSLTVHADTSSALGLHDAGRVRTNVLTGEVGVVWERVAVGGGEGRLELYVLRPLERFEFTLEDPSGWVFEAIVEVEDAREDPALVLTMTVEHEDAPLQELLLPVEGAATWPAGGGLLPSSGDFVWRQRHSGLDRSVTGHPVDTVEDLVWPVVVEAQDWAALREVDLSR